MTADNVHLEKLILEIEKIIPEIQKMLNILENLKHDPELGLSPVNVGIMSTLVPILKILFVIEMVVLVISVCFNNSNHKGDAPSSLQTILQDPCSPSMEGIFSFNGQLLSLITGIIVLTAWIIAIVLEVNLEVSRNEVEEFHHSSLIEILWTSFPALILLCLSIPSFSLLYAMDEVTAAELSMKIIGHQWFWSYENSDFMTCFEAGNLKYSSYLFSPEFLKRTSVGLARNLETNKRFVVPGNSHLRLLITAVDVLHSWTIPSFGVKIDACPGRLNQANVFVKRYGMFYGQCSEICGVNHGFMPVSLISLPIEQFHYLITAKFK